MSIHWLTAFADYPVAESERGSAFWQAVTDTTASVPRGESAEFVTLVPRQGDAFLRVQRLGNGPARVHLDLHVDDIRASTARAEQLGASVLADFGSYLTLTSPGGYVFCIVLHHGENDRPPPVQWPGGQRSLVDQVAIDIPPLAYEAECAFWEQLTGWPSVASSEPEFRFLSRPAGTPLRFLLQRLVAPLSGPCTAHLDLACDNVPAETARHEVLGASVVRVTPGWTTLIDPAGLLYCVTGRNPDTGNT